MKNQKTHEKASIYLALALAAFAAASFSSCATLTGLTASGGREDAELSATEPSTPGAAVSEAGGQPEWTRKTPKSAEFLYVTGYGKVTDRTTSTKRAVADGKDQISRWLETKVQSILLEHTAETASSSRTAVTATALEVSRSVSRASISGVVQKDLWVDSEGGVWVLLEVPRSVPVRQFEEAAKTLTRKDAAAYSEQKMREALKKLEEEL